MLMNKSQRSESNRQPPHYECGALPIEATLAELGLMRILTAVFDGSPSLAPAYSVKVNPIQYDAPPTATDGATSHHLTLGGEGD